MTATKLLWYGILLAVGMAPVKIFFYRNLDWESSGAVHYIYWLFIAFFSVALVRRLGHISFLESFIVIGLWTFFMLLLDLMFTAQVLDYRIFINIPFVLGYFIMIVACFMFHKKRHVKIRHEMAAKNK